MYVGHPEARPVQLIGTSSFVSPTPKQIREDAERRASGIERYERFKADLDELLTVIKTFDYGNPLDAATVEVAVEPKTAVLGELLAAPDRFDHLGKRGEVPDQSLNSFPNP